jgi:outer membrane lipoprotein-sorting protein
MDREVNVMRSISAFLFVLILTSIAGAQTYTTEQVLAEMDKNSKKFTSLQALIEQQKFNELTKKTEISQGKIYIESKGSAPRFKLEVTEPKKTAKTLLIDKGRAQIYEHQPNTLTEHKVGNQSSLDLFLMGFGTSSDKIKKTYNVTSAGQETLEGKPVSLLVLTAIQSTADFPKIRLWISQKDWNAVQVELTEKTRDTQLVKYKDVKLNKAIPGSVFKLNLPSNVIKAK